MRNWWALLPFLLLAACGNNANPASLDSPDVLFHDEFIPGQTAGWQIEGDNLGQSAIIDERLVIELAAPNTLQFVTLPDQTFADFVMDVDVQQLRGDLGNSYGLLFRLQDTSQFYRFEVTGNGLYMLERRNADGTWTRFVDDWTAVVALNQGLNVTNHLRVTARGPSISVAVNDVVVQEINDTHYAAGAIALDAGTFIQPEMAVAFDNIVVRQP